MNVSLVTTRWRCLDGFSEIHAPVEPLLSRFPSIMLFDVFDDLKIAILMSVTG